MIFPAKAGIAGLEFYAGIPGTIGGALRMNAGCYGAETQDVLVEAVAIDRRGRRQVMSVDEFGYRYRGSDAPSDLIFTQAIFKGETDDVAAITERMNAMKKASLFVKKRVALLSKTQTQSSPAVAGRGKL